MSGGAGFGVYLHWPYCAAICPYCDFNVYKERDIDAARWRAALAADLRYWAARTKGRKLTSLYFGGGTPSLAPLTVIEGVIEECEKLWGFADDPEITLEANPTDAELSRFADFAKAGVNRLSLGVQSFNDAALSFLGRHHDGLTAERALDRAMRAFPRVTLDLIYALPEQGLAGWSAELKKAIASGAGHLSLYQLTIEEETAFARAVKRGAWRPADEELAADLFDATQDITASAGLPAYEISNHARQSEASRHNLLYWRQQDYAGVGPGAHGRVTLDGKTHAVETHRRPDAYLECIETSGCGASLDDPLTDEERLIERLAMGLRLSEGFLLRGEEYRLLAARLDALCADGLLI
ncbi:MAG: radical SAM family heme chaperone HemW, partial [Parvularculaceae bacterium]